MVSESPPEPRRQPEPATGGYRALRLLSMAHCGHGRALRLLSMAHCGHGQCSAALAAAVPAERGPATARDPL